MDGQTLQNLFSGTNPFLAQMGEQAFNLDQQKRQADLQSILGQESRANAMHPLEMDSRRASTALNNSTAKLNEYSLDTKLPKEQALAQVMQKFHKETDDVTREQTRAQVLRQMQIAAVAKQNGGMIPDSIRLSPEEMKMYAPQNLDKIIKYGETFLQYDPEEIGKRQRAKEELAKAESVARIGAQGRIDAKNAGGGGGPVTTDVPKTYGEVLAAMQKSKKPEEKLAYLKSVLPALSPELQQQLYPAYQGLKTQVDAGMNARTAGQVDVAATTDGKVKVTPKADSGAAPGQVKPPQQISQADLEFTAKKHNMTVEQVKQKLGIK